MRIHHLNLCSMCPYGGRLISGEGSFFGTSDLVVHALLVESRDGLVLVDTGLGLEDVKQPKKRLGRPFVTIARPRLREEQTAVRQIERLGFRRSDVKHVVVTHLDLDHAGGIVDFPDAQIHVHADEHAAATKPATFGERHRYRKVHFAHGPRWRLHSEGGEDWLGFASVRAVSDDVRLVPLPGHTRGHSAVAVRAPEGSGVEWFLHCGDAYFFHGEIGQVPWCPPALAAYQRLVAVENKKRVANLERLRELYRDRGARVRMFSSHCPFEYRAASAASARTAQVGATTAFAS